MKSLLLRVLLVSVSLATQVFAITSVSVGGSPNPVYTSSGFTVNGSGSDDYGEITALTLYGPSGYVGSVYPDAWNRYNISNNWSQTAPGSPTSLSYTAYLDTDSTSTSASTSVSVISSNQAPTIQWVTNPGSVNVNQSFTVQAKGMDADGNLTNVFVWRSGSPFAFNGGGTGYESTSDGNTYSQSTPGTVTFTAQAQDSNGATSAIISWTVTINNNPPAIAWYSGPSSAYVNQYFTVRARGTDADGNLSYVNVWRDTAPFAFNGGGTGYESISDNNGHTGTGPGTVVFTTQAGDSAGANTSVITHNVSIINRSPVNPTITPSGAVTLISGNNYYMWIGDTITLNSTVSDPDSNLTGHSIYYQKVTGSTPTGSWTLIGNSTPSNPGSSSKSVTYTPNLTGRWDFNMGATDGTASVGNSITVYVYGPTNGATFVSQSVSTTAMATGSTRSVSVTYQNTGDKPWTTDGSPHRLGSQNPGDNTTWGWIRVPLAAGETVAPNASKTFTFTITAPTTPGNYNFQWRMLEEGVEWFGDQSTNLVIPVTDQAAPSVTAGLNATAKTHNSFTLNWTASTDNVGVTGYEVMRDATSLGTAAGASRAITGLTANTTYVMKVRARDAAGNWSAWSTVLNVTTNLDPNLDSDSDGLTNGDEALLGTNATTAASNDTSNTLQLKIHRPNN